LTAIQNCVSVQYSRRKNHKTSQLRTDVKEVVIQSNGIYPVMFSPSYQHTLFCLKKHLLISFILISHFSIDIYRHQALSTNYKTKSKIPYV